MPEITVETEVKSKLAENVVEKSEKKTDELWEKDENYVESKWKKHTGISKSIDGGAKHRPNIMIGGIHVWGKPASTNRQSAELTSVNRRQLVQSWDSRHKT